MVWIFCWHSGDVVVTIYWNCVFLLISSFLLNWRQSELHCRSDITAKYPEYQWLQCIQRHGTPNDLQAYDQLQTNGTQMVMSSTTVRPIASCRTTATTPSCQPQNRSTLLASRSSSHFRLPSTSPQPIKAKKTSSIWAGAHWSVFSLWVGNGG